MCECSLPVFGAYYHSCLKGYTVPYGRVSCGTVQPGGVRGRFRLMPQSMRRLHPRMGWEHHSMTLQYLSEEQRVTAIVHAKLPLPF